jgi:hypothetical protein
MKKYHPSGVASNFVWTSGGISPSGAVTTPTHPAAGGQRRAATLKRRSDARPLKGACPLVDGCGASNGSAPRNVAKARKPRRRTRKKEEGEAAAEPRRRRAAAG